MVILVKGIMMIMDYNENIGAHFSDEYDHMKQMSREGHNALWDHRYLTKLYVSSVLVSTMYGRSSELGLSNLHLCSNSSYSSNWIGEGLWLTV